MTLKVLDTDCEEVTGTWFYEELIISIAKQVLVLVRKNEMNRYSGLPGVFVVADYGCMLSTFRK